MFLVVFISLALSNATIAQQQKVEPKTNVLDENKKVEIVEVACGECQFKMAGAGCDLAVKIAGLPYFVTGTSIDEHGDAHAKDGFCNAIRKAAVQGEIVDNHFMVTYLKLIPLKMKADE